MEEILKELSNMDQFNQKKEEYIANQQKIKEEKKKLDELHKKFELTLLGSNDRENAQKEYDDKKEEIEDKENKISENKEKTIKEFEEQKTKIIKTIDSEMSKYKKKAEIDALISQKNAYVKMAENSKKGIERMIADINDGKDIDYYMSLKMERGALQENTKRAEELDAEIKGYKVLEDNEKVFSDLTYLRTRMQGMNFDNIKNIKDDIFFKEYGKEQLEKEEAFQKELEAAQQRKEKREEKIKAMSREEFKEYYTGKEEQENNSVEQEPKKVIANVKQKEKQDRKISIKFNAKQGCFITQDEEDLKIGKKQKIKVDEISTENKEKLKQYVIKQYSLDNEAVQKLDMNVVAILHVYDKNKDSNKMEKYIEIVSKENKEPAKSKLRDNGISINYDMRGLYRNKKLEKQTKRELMNFANVSKENGVAEVRKDIRTYISEKIDKLIFQKIDSRKTKKIEPAKTEKQADKFRFSYKLEKEDMQKEKNEMDKAADKIVQDVREIMQKDEER